MTNPAAIANFEERLAILTQELELAIHWQRPCVLMVTCGSEFTRTEATSMLESYLHNHNQKVMWVHAADPNQRTVADWQASENTVFFVDGVGDLALSGSLQHEYLALEKCLRLVFWLNYHEASRLAYQVPALWANRSRLIEFSAPPTPEQTLQMALESAWQKDSEPAQQPESLEVKPAHAPRQAEITTVQVNLLLALGVLHWRKGNFEQATETLQKALKSASALADDNLEAECFNALALVRSHLGKHVDAIEAYKQAIKLAPNQISVWNNLGNLCLKINRHHEALIAFQKALEQNASDAVAWNGLGDVYSLSGYTNEAIAAYSKASEHAPLLSYPWHGLGEIYLRTHHFTSSMQAFQKALELNPRFVPAWLGLANVCIRQKQHRTAARAYQQAIALEPKNCTLWNDLGCLYLEAEQFEEAVEAFLKAIEIEPEYGWAYSNVAFAYTQQGKPQDSLPLYLKGLDLITDAEQKTTTWNRLANAYRQMHDYENAIKAYQQADSHPAEQHIRNMASDEDHAQTHPQSAPVSVTEPAPETEATIPEERSELNLVELQMQKPESQPAMSEAPYWIFESSPQPTSLSNVLFEMASPHPPMPETRGSHMQMIYSAPATIVAQEALQLPRLDTAGARAWNEKGNLRFRESAFEEATHAYNKAIQLDRTFGLPYCNLGITYLHLGRYAEAILLLHKSLELLETDSDRAIAWNELGNLYRCLNDYHNALVAYQKADELSPDHAGVRDVVEFLHTEPNASNAGMWTELGDTFFKSGAYQKASDCYRKAVEMEPGNGRAYNNLALSLTYQSRFEEAAPLYEQSIELLQNDTERADAWNRLGNVYRRLYNYDKAIAAYQNAVKLKHDRKTLLTRARFSLLGNCYVEQ